MKRTDGDFQDEVQAHLDLETDRLVADGWPPDEARAAARRAFGSVLAAHERFHEASRWIWIEQLAQDLRYGWRGLWHSPAFVATTVLTLAIGIGLVTVLFTVFNAYVLRPFAVRDPHSLYAIRWRAAEDAGRTFRWRDYEELRDRRDLFDAAIAERTRLVSSNGRPLTAAFVSGNYFETLGVRMLIGRPLAELASTPAAESESVAVLSHQAWTRLFDADPAALGRELDVNGRRLAIVGVLRPEFSGLDDSPRDIWMPLTIQTPIERELGITVRLRRDVTPERAHSALAPLMTRMLDRSGDRADRGGAVRAEVVSSATPNPLSLKLIALLSPVFAAFGLVLVAACANVSNVMLARANVRDRMSASTRSRRSSGRSIRIRSRSSRCRSRRWWRCRCIRCARPPSSDRCWAESRWRSA